MYVHFTSCVYGVISLLIETWIVVKSYFAVSRILYICIYFSSYKQSLLTEVKSEVWFEKRFLRNWNWYWSSSKSTEKRKRMENCLFIISWHKVEKWNTKKLICTAQKMRFSIKDLLSKCDQIRSFLRIWSRLLKRSLMENFIFCAVLAKTISNLMFLIH